MTSGSAAVTATALPLLLLLGYSGLYLACVSASFPIPDPTAYNLRCMESYSVGGNVAKALFAPANWVDRKIRPSYWEFEPLTEAEVEAAFRAGAFSLPPPWFCSH
ncbi:hypothetical protein ACFL59_01230 [Planctomycetota bacterium]